MGGGNKPGTSSKPINEIFVKVIEGEDGMVYYQAYAKYAVTSNIKVNVVSTNGTVTELDLYVGDTLSKPEIGESKEFSVVTLSVTEDTAYVYETVTEDINQTYDIYFKAVRLVESGTLTSDFTKTSMKMNTTTDLRFVIEATDVNYNEMTDMDEFEAFCVENQNCLGLFLPKSIYENKSYMISNYGGADVTGNFGFEKYTSVDGVDYAYIVEKATDDIFPFVPLYNEELVYEYKLTLNK